MPRPRLYNLTQMHDEAAVIFGKDIAIFFPANNGHSEVYSLEHDFEIIGPLQVLLLGPFKGAVIPFPGRAVAGF